jgi:hypothetical protein
MFPDVGYSYAEYDLYQSLKGNNAVNASVFRMAVQPTKFLEVGANLWFNQELSSNPDKIVISTKWRVWIYQSEKIKLSLSPGSWSSIYFNEYSVKNLGYCFAGLTINHSKYIYTRFMLGGYGKYWKSGPEAIGQEEFTSGLIAGLEQRLTKELVFVTDYFQGSGEGFGLATGFVCYLLKGGTNLPIYAAYQFDNDSRENDLVILQLGYFFRAYSNGKK